MKRHRIYVASSWRNEYHGLVVEALCSAGCDVYDFKDPAAAFSWRDAHPSGFRKMSADEHRGALAVPVARRGFLADMGALAWCTSLVLVLPCGRSAHTEAGWAKGQGRPVHVYQPEPQEPDLMYSMFDSIDDSLVGLLAHFD